MDRLKRALDNDLRRMQDLRNQISEKRYELNLNLHNLAFVDEVGFGKLHVSYYSGINT